MLSVRVGLAAVAVSLLLPVSASATARFVDQGGGGAPPCKHRANPCDEIATAVSGLHHGDRIFVGAGTYDDPVILAHATVLRDRRVFAGGRGPAILDNGSQEDGDDTLDAMLPGDGALVRNLTIRSPTRPVRTIGRATIRQDVFDQATPPSALASIPDWNCGNPLVEIANGNNPPTIRNSVFEDPVTETDADQTGVCVPPGTEATVRKNHFENLVNAVHIEGGSGDSDGLDPVVDRNVINGARATPTNSGSAVFVRGSTPTITGNSIGPPAGTEPAADGIAFTSLVPAPTGATLARNRIQGFGVGIDARETTAPVKLNGDLIVGNAIGFQGIDFGDNGDANISARLVTVFDSSTAEIHLQDADVTLSSSIIGAHGIDDTGNSTCSIEFSRGPAITPDDCDAYQTTADPAFVDSAGGNYHLMEGSPMIDASNAVLVPGETDMDRDPRPLDGQCPEGQAGILDLGADEFNCPPQTSVRGPKGRTEDRTPTYRLKSTDRGSSFQCKVDSHRYRACKKRVTLRLEPGLHRLRFRARDKQGNLDPTPVRRRVHVLRS